MLCGLALCAAPAGATMPGDNGRIYFESGGDIWSANSDGSNRIQLTTAGTSRGATVSADGELVAFETDQGSGTRLAVMNWDGTGQHLVTEGDLGNEGAPSFGPDDQIAFRAGSSIYVIDADGSGLDEAAPTGSRPALSPDGIHVAHSIGGGTLFVTDIGTGVSAELTPDDLAALFDFDYAPDGSILALVRFTGDDGETLVRIDEATGNITDELLEDPSILTALHSIAPAPDGNGFAIGTTYNGPGGQGSSIGVNDGPVSWGIAVAGFSAFDTNPAWGPARADDPATALTPPAGDLPMTAEFEFSSPTSGASFQCSVTRSAYPYDIHWTPCVSPASYDLEGGDWFFAVRAVVAGIADPSPAVGAFTVDPTLPPPNDRPATLVSRSAELTPLSWTFSSNTGVFFQCSVDGSEFDYCPTPFLSGRMPEGPHTLSVRAVDEAWHEDPTPATLDVVVRDWTEITAPGTGTADVPEFHRPRVEIEYWSPAGNQSFQCRLDRGSWLTCDPDGSDEFSGIAPGLHTIKVRSRNELNVADPTPDSVSFVVTPGVRIDRSILPGRINGLRRNGAGVVARTAANCRVDVQLRISESVADQLGIRSLVIGEASKRFYGHAKVTARLKGSAYRRFIESGATSLPYSVQVDSPCGVETKPAPAKLARLGRKTG